MIKRIISTAMAFGCILLCACSPADLPTQNTTPAVQLTPSITATPTNEVIDISAHDIDSFRFVEEDLGICDEFSISKNDLTAHILIHDFYEPEKAFTQTWTQEKWDAFTEDLIACGFTQWEEASFQDDVCYDGSWHLTVTGNFGEITKYGAERPNGYDLFENAFRENFLWSYPMPSESPAEDIELVAEAFLPTPQQGEWYEWSHAGSYPSNPDNILNYIETEELLLLDNYMLDLKTSHLDGSATKLLANDVYVSNYYDGWIYYQTDDSIFKIRPNDTEKQFVTSIKDLMYYHMFIYDGTLYFTNNGNNLPCYDLEEENIGTLVLPHSTIGPYFFENGYLYYTGSDSNLSGGSTIFRYDLETEESKELASNTQGSFVVRNGMLYYISDGLMRTDGTITEKVKSSVRHYFNLYRNYLLYINFNGDWTCTLYALDLDTEQEYELFTFNEPLGASNSGIYVMENSVFLYEPIYQITFEDDKARLWRLNSLSSQLQ